MNDTQHPVARGHGSPSARRVGIASASAVTSIGILYVGVIALWLVVEATPREPIGDPYLSVMEGLTILSAVALIGLVIAVRGVAEPTRALFAQAALLFGSSGAVLTMAVHFVQLTAVRQLWQADQLADYRLVWPSMLFAVEYFAWDVLIGLAMICTGGSLLDISKATSARRAFLIGGSLCLLGAVGPLSGWMVVQNVALFGYGVVLPVASALLARLFYSTNPGTGEQWPTPRRGGRRGSR